MNIDLIAKKAGVSRATVSRVINHFPGIKEETRKKVEDVIKEVNYIPSAAARSLVRKKSNIIGALIYNITQPFWGNYISGIESGVDSTDYGLFFANSKKHKTFWDYQKTYKENLKNLVSHGVDGVIMTLLNDLEKEDIDFLESVNIPYIVMQNCLDDPRIVSVNVDNVQGGYDATNYLIGLGHQTIGHITGLITSGIGKARLEGFSLAMEQAGLQVIPDNIVYGGHSFKDGYWGMKQLMTHDNPPTAVFIASDESAYGGIYAAREMNIRVPEDVSVIGFDGIRDTFDHSAYLPVLTTMKQPTHEMGKIAAEMMVAWLDGERPEQPTIIMKATLTEGKTCLPYK
ncbi:MAG: LacI family DNA-binding transcriptional regulator [Ruminiclostridium sp.]